MAYIGKVSTYDLDSEGLNDTVCQNLPLTPIANYFQQKSPPSVRYIVNEQTVSPNPIGKEFLKLPPTSNKNTSLMAMK